MLLASEVWITCVGTTRYTCDDVLGVALLLDKVVAVDLSAILADVLKVVAVDLSAILADVLGVPMLMVFCEFVAVDIPAIFVDVVGTIGCRGAVEEITWQFRASILLYYTMHGRQKCIYAINRKYVYLYSISVSHIYTWLLVSQVFFYVNQM